MIIHTLANLVSVAVVYFELEWHQLLTGIILLILGRLLDFTFKVLYDELHT